MTKEKVGELKVVSLTPDKQMGLFPPDADSKAGDDKGAAAAGEPTRSPPNRPSRPNPNTPGKHSAAAAAGSYHIVGRFKLDRGKRKVQTPHGA